MASFHREFSLDKTDLQSSLIGIFEEHGGEGNFVVNCFIWESLRKQDSAFCLLSLKHTFNHYLHVGLKLGYNLSTLKSRAIVIEGLKTVYLSASEECSLNPLNECGLKNMFQNIKKHCELLFEKYQKVFLMVDDLSYLLSIGFTKNNVLTFCHYLRTLQSKSVTVVLLTSCLEKDSNNVSLKCFLEQNCDIKFYVSPLLTGTARDISGSIRMIKKRCALNDLSKEELYHYKLTDRNLRLFSPGCL